MKKKFSKIRQYLSISRLNLILAFIILFFLLFFMRLDFDGGHEGYLLSTAIALKDGNKMFLDFYSLYGPILPLVHSLAILNQDYANLCLRIFDDLIIASICFLFLNLIRFKNISIRYGYLVFTIIVWVCLSYFFFGQTQLAWSSTLALLFQIILLNLICNVYTDLSDKSSKYLSEIGIATMLVVLPLTRLNTGLLTNFVTLVFMFLMSHKNAKFQKTWVRVTLLGTLFSGVVLFYFYIQGSLRSMYEQSLVMPIRLMTSSYVVGSDNWNALPVIGNYFVRSLPFIFLLLIGLSIFDRMQYFKLFSALKAKFFKGFLISIVTIFFGFILITMLHSTQRLAWSYSRLIVFLTIFGIIAALYLLFSEVIFEKLRFFHIRFPVVLLCLYGLSGIIQIYPTHDARHIWMGLPFLLLALPLFIEKLNWRSPSGDVAFITILLLSLPVFPLMISGAIHTYSPQRVSVDFSAPFKGMLVYPADYTRLKSEFLFLKKHLAPTQTAFFECGHGQTYWEATFDGNYHSQSKWFVDFSDFPGVPSPDWQMKNDDLLIICGEPSIQAAMASKFKVSIFDSNEYLAIAIKKN